MYKLKLYSNFITVFVSFFIYLFRQQQQQPIRSSSSNSAEEKLSRLRDEGQRIAIYEIDDDKTRIKSSPSGIQLVSNRFWQIQPPKIGTIHREIFEPHPISVTIDNGNHRLEEPRWRLIKEAK